MAVPNPLSTAAAPALVGVSLNADTVAASMIAAAVVVGLGLWTRAQITSGTPGRMQLAWETVLEMLDRRLEKATGRAGGAAVPLAISLFLFILVANSLRVIPTTSGWLPTATADLDLTVALALIVFVVSISAPSPRSPSYELPELITSYLKAHQAHDLDAL